MRMRTRTRIHTRVWHSGWDVFNFLARLLLFLKKGSGEAPSSEGFRMDGFFEITRTVLKGIKNGTLWVLRKQ